MSVPYLIAEGNAASGSASQALTPSTGSAAGDTLLAFSGTQVGSLSTVSDTESNPWALAKSDSGQASAATWAWIAPGATTALTGGDTVTYAYSGTGSAKAATVAGISGLASSPLDQAVSADSASSAAPSVTSGTLAVASEICVAACVYKNAGGSITWGAGWTVIGTNQKFASNQTLSVAYQAVTATTAVTASATLGAATNCSIVLLTLRPASVTPVYLSNPLTGGVPGAALTLAATALTGTELDAIFSGSGVGTVAYDATEALWGPVSVQIATPSGSAVLAQGRWAASMGTQVTTYAGAAFRFGSRPPALNRLIAWETPGGSNCGTAHINTSGQILFRDSTGSPILTSATVTPLGTWWYLEAMLTGSATAGVVGFRLRVGNPGQWAAETYEQQISTAGVANTVGAAGEYDFGISTATAAVGPFNTAWWQLSDTTWCGPPPGASPGAVASFLC